MRSLQARSHRSPFVFDTLLGDFDRIFDGFRAPPSEPATAPVNARVSSFLPPYELAENDQGYHLSFDIPGIPKDDVQVEVKDQQLRVFGERKSAGAATGEAVSECRFTERRYGAFERVFTLPDNVDNEKIQAHHQDGVLHLMLPKMAKSQAKSIKIEIDPPEALKS